MMENNAGQTYKAYLEGMDRYIEELEAMESIDPVKAKKEAKNSLIRSGVLDKKGNPKKQICE